MIDLLVVGAGPTGLLMAAEALRHQLSCRIIDERESPWPFSRALVIQPRTLEIFDHLGILAPFLEKGVKIEGASPHWKNEVLTHLSFQDLDSPYPFALILEQTETEAILTEYLSSFGVSVERGLRCVDLKEEKRNVVVQVEGKASEIIHAQWVVGADGAHSQVRKCLHFPFLGKANPSIFSLADVKIDWKGPSRELSIFLDPEGVLGVIPMPGAGCFRLVFQLKRCLDLGKEVMAGRLESSDVPDPTIEEVEEKVWRALGREVKVLSAQWMANFYINSRLAQSYQKGRVFLAGDAAHIHSPMGGQGMNSGLQDVFNLAWKLATRNEKIIETYTLERRFWGKRLVFATRLATWVMTLKNPLGIFLRNGWIRWMAFLFQKKIIRAISQISIRYPKSSVVWEKGSFQGGPRAGMRAPNIPLDEEGSDLYSYLRKKKGSHLLIFGKIKEAPLWDSVVHIQNEEAKRIYGIKKPSIYWIRPDQVIGFRTTMSIYPNNLKSWFLATRKQPENNF